MQVFFSQKGAGTPATTNTFSDSVKKVLQLCYKTNEKEQNFRNDMSYQLASQRRNI